VNLNIINYVTISYDAIKGIGYFIVNNIVYNFTSPEYFYMRKQIIYGDFFILNDKKTDLFNISNSILDNISLLTDYVPLEFTSLLFNVSNIDVQPIIMETRIEGNQLILVQNRSNSFRR
jgi:hypothetical protein